MEEGSRSTRTGSSERHNNQRSGHFQETITKLGKHRPPSLEQRWKYYESNPVLNGTLDANFMWSWGLSCLGVPMVHEIVVCPILWFKRVLPMCRQQILKKAIVVSYPATLRHVNSKERKDWGCHFGTGHHRPVLCVLLLRDDDKG